MPGRPQLILIAALSKNRVIGRDGSLPWRLPDDLRRFKELTQGHTIILGRKTYESIGRPLPHRRNLIVTRNPAFVAAGCETALSLEAALDRCVGEEQVFVIGGGELYRLALPRADRLELTRVDAEVDGDTTMPEWLDSEWREIGRVTHPADERHAYAFTFITLSRIQRLRGLSSAGIGH